MKLLLVALLLSGCQTVSELGFAARERVIPTSWMTWRKVSGRPRSVVISSILLGLRGL